MKVVRFGKKYCEVVVITLDIVVYQDGFCVSSVSSTSGDSLVEDMCVVKLYSSGGTSGTSTSVREGEDGSAGSVVGVEISEYVVRCLVGGKMEEFSIDIRSKG